MSTWTPERIEEVTRLWGEGLTTAEIGKIVGVSKNAVVGKAHRLGLPSRPSPIRRSRSNSATVKARTQIKPQEKIVQKVAISTSGASCMWPHGHPGEPGFHFCGSPSIVNKSYCPKHYQMAYLPARPRAESKPNQVRKQWSGETSRRAASAA